MRKKIFLLFFCFSNTISYAQGKRDSLPLFDFLQQNFDTTIVLSTGSIWSPWPDLKMISKHNNELLVFTYKDPFLNYKRKGLPARLYTKFNKQENLFNNILPDTNLFFLPVPVSYLIEPIIKKSLDSLQLWSISGDEKDGWGCKEKDCEILDSVGYTIWLITRSDRKKISFYDPSFYENCCPGRIGRQKVLLFLKLINTFVH